MEFKTTIGHRKQKEFFLRAARNGRLAHAYALSGPENVGKTTFALDFTQNCLGTHPMLDLFVFDQESGMTIAEARVLKQRLTRRAVASSYKVAVVSYGEKMTLEAANALLKILEEPPGNSVIFLTTSNFYSLLPTIASRLEFVNFGCTTGEEIREALNKFNLPEDKLVEIVQFSNGRIGLARELAQNEEEFEFLKLARRYCQVLYTGNLIERMRVSGELSERSNLEIQKFIKFGMEDWVKQASQVKIAQKLQIALRDLDFNLNTKLLLDNLFLS